MTWEINENNTTKIARYDTGLHGLWIDWVARNLYFLNNQEPRYIVKLDLTMWENGIIKFDKIMKTKAITYMNVLPSMGYVYYHSPEKIIFH